MSIKVAVVEDHASVREALTAILNGSPGFRCAAACRDANEALRAVPPSRPDVVLMDLHLPGLSGIECVRALKRELPAVQIIMLTIESDGAKVLESLQAGATGYLVKNLPPAEILEAIEEVMRGGAPMTSQIARMLVRTFQNLPGSAREESSLTAREREILTLISKGYRTKEAAAALRLSPLTVQTHIRNIYEKLHVRSRAEAVARFLNR